MTTFTFRRSWFPAIFFIFFSLVLAVPAGAWGREAEKAPFSDAPQADAPAAKAGPSLFGLDTALGLVGLPGLSSPADDNETTYEKARRMQNGPNGNARLSYGERYRRNPDGSYGSQSSSQWNGVGSVADNLLQQALSAGSGWFSSWAEGFLGGYGKARLSFRLNDQGELSGAGDFLLPLYDSEHSTSFTQLGLRTMPGERVIGNFGLGQRFFPAENFALGYNVFLDQDFSRDHTRGGAGLEAWYDWLRLSANYYTPLSGWKDSRDYDSYFVEERPAEGYDARLTGYLPFYRHLAVTGAFEQWKGEHVGSFGSNDVVQKDPQVWSYGLEWTPVPALSASVSQRHSGSQKETRFGLSFNYHFGMSWEEQLSPAVVAEMRTVEGSRHDFVNRQNEMILEYRAKEGVFNIVLSRTVDEARNIFEFQVSDAFGPAAGQSVTVTAEGGATVLDPNTGLALSQFTTDAKGRIWVQLSPLAAGAVQVTLSVGKTSRAFALNVSPLARLNLSAAIVDPVTATATVTAAVLDAAGQGVSGVTLTWETDPADSSVTLTPGGDTGNDGKATATVTSTTAQVVKVKASATVNGVLMESEWLEAVFSDNAYVLTANPAFLAVNQQASVTFTLTKSGSAAPDGTVITFTQDAGNFDGLTASAINLSNSDGTFSMTALKGLSTGEKTLRATVDGVKVTCLIKVKGLRLSATDGGKFVTATDPGYSNGYQSTGRVVARFDNGTSQEAVSESITWKLKSVTTPSGAGTWWNRSSATTHGLNWGNNFGSPTPENPVITINDPSTDTDSEIEITDIVGSRSVTLEASVTIDSVTYTEEVTVNFGDGPLSVFATDSSSMKQWAADYTDTGFRNLNGSDPTDFPVAVEVANGSVKNNSFPSNPNSNPPVSNADWRYTDIDVDSSYRAYYAEGSNLPTVEQLQAVSKSSSYNPVGGKGAAFAAGWSNNWCWSGEVLYDDGLACFAARIVDPTNGYGSFDNVFNDFYNAVGVLP